jgi:hypothetical protein
VYSPVNWDLAPNSEREKGTIFLESYEARIGTSVVVLDGTKRPGKGRLCTIVQTYGHPDYLAVDVLFEDGSVELYWYYQLRTMEQPLP